jgi:sugar lactone lactonase YvrE
MPNHFELVCDHLCTLGEGTVWDAAGSNIYWIDIANGEIHRKGIDTGLQTCRVGQAVGSIALRSQGGLIGALKNGIFFIDFEKQQLDEVASPEASLIQNRFNDGKCDPSGRFWVGTMNLDEKSPTGNLYMLETDLNIQLKIPGTKISNGMAWNGAGDTFYFIDSPTFTVRAFDFDCQTGTISNGRTAIHVPKEMGYPDGMTIDADDMLWIALFDGWGVSQWNPETGRLLQQIKLPVSQVSCCTFGGPSLKDLYISTASIRLKREQLKEQPLAGGLFIIPDCGSAGSTTQKFGG